MGARGFAIHCALLSVAGALTPLAFAPFGQWWLAILGLAVLFYRAARAGSGKAAFVFAAVFSWWFFAVGLWWIFLALSGYIGLPAPLALVAWFLFSALLACFPAAAMMLAWQTAKSTNRRAAAMAFAWVLAEFLRATMFTGFPWLAVGYSQASIHWAASPLLGFAPWLGVFGVGLAVTLSAAILAMAPSYRLWWWLPLLFVGGWGVSQYEWTTKQGELEVSLLQGNVTQRLKWREGEVERALADYRRLAHSSRGRLIVLPETALPMQLEDVPPEYASFLRQLAIDRGGAVVSGVFLREVDGLYNGAVALGDFAAETYRKQHLTPFGEYLPFAAVLAPLLEWAGIPFFFLAAGKNESAMPILRTVAGVSICYEDAFGGEWRRQLPRAEFLLNLTNDAWFDGSAMPAQHLQISQMRAAEFGRWLARATNTGATATIDHRGRLRKTLPLQTQGVLEATIELRRGATPFARFGDWPVLLLCVAALAAMVWRGKSSLKKMAVFAIIGI